MLYRPDLLEPRVLSLGLHWRRHPTGQEGDETNSGAHNTKYSAKHSAK
jgi:hypothetical protein